MCIITGLISGIVAASTAISAAASAVGGAIATGVSAVGGALSSAGAAIAGSAATQALANVGFGMIGAVGGSHAIAAAPTWLGVTLGAATVAGGVATVGMGVAGAIQNARVSHAQEDYQKAMIKAMNEQDASISDTTQKTASGIHITNRMARTMSSLRVPLAALNPNKQNEQAIQNVYGADNNNVAQSTKNMTGLNIAA
jgi:hypothetical protein